MHRVKVHPQDEFMVHCTLENSALVEKLSVIFIANVATDYDLLFFKPLLMNNAINITNNARNIKNRKYIVDIEL